MSVPKKLKKTEADRIAYCVQSGFSILAINGVEDFRVSVSKASGSMALKVVVADLYGNAFIYKAK